jgi:hypothetical protein
LLAAGCRKKDTTGLRFTETAYTLSLGETIYLTFEITPSNGRQTRVTSKSEWPDIVSVPYGSFSAVPVTGEIYGTSVITATVGHGIEASCTVTVTGNTGKSLSEMMELFRNLQYHVSFHKSLYTIDGYGHIPEFVANKETGIFTEISVAIFPTRADAELCLPFFQSMLPYSCKIDGNNIYWGAQKEVAIYEGTESGTDEPENSKTASQITSAFQTAGYNVQSQTIAGMSALVAVKGVNTLTVITFPSVALATEAKPTYDAAAQAMGQTCKRDGKNVYYGTAAAVAVYDAIA